MKKSIHQFLIALIAVGICLIFLALSFFLPLTTTQRFNSPDEMSNSFFANQFAIFGRLWYFDPLNLLVPDFVHPRSTRVVDSFLVPGGFIGLPLLYGGIGKILGGGIIPFLTPFFAILGALFWGLLIRKLYKNWTGFFAGLLLLFHPVWWYESSRTMQPNILFCVLLLGAAYFFIAAPFQEMLTKRDVRGFTMLRWSDTAIAGIFLGLAIAVRMSEVFWLAAGFLAVCFIVRREIPWKRFLIFFFFAFVTLMPFLFLNKSLYGHYLATGYGYSVGDVSVTFASRGFGAKLLGPLQPIFFPLGFAPRTALVNFVKYGVTFFWWWSILVIVSLWGIFSQIKKNVPLLTFFLSSSFWLILFYGSWIIQDNPDPKAVTIGSSYLRYWLPIFIFSTFPVALFFSKIVDGGRSFLLRWKITVFFSIFVLISGLTLLFAHQEGILAMRKNLLRYNEIAKEINQRVPKGSLLIVDRADKIFFPDHSVMYPFRSETTYTAIAKLKGRADLWYFGITFPEKDIQYLREEKLLSIGLTIDPVVTFGEETLYHFSSLKVLQ